MEPICFILPRFAGKRRRSEIAKTQKMPPCLRRAALHALIRDFRARGKTIVLASHDMAEVEILCDRIAILRAGSVAFLGTVAELSTRLGKRYNISVKTTRGSMEIATDDIEKALPALLERCRNAGEAIVDIHVGRGSLEEHFLQTVRGGNI